jgi:carbon monoxide dehydrogenase subunit G
VRLANELRVGAPLEQTWRALLDVPSVAKSMPGATIEPEPVDGAYRGTMKVRLGPVSAEYAGLARLQDVDEDEHVASIHLRGREAHGQGSAEATLTIRVRDDGDATRVQVETDLVVSGRQAQLGRGIMEEVAAGMLRQFAVRLEHALGAGDHEGEGARTEAFDAGLVLYGPLLERLAIAFGGVIVGIALGRVIWRR